MKFIDFTQRQLVGKSVLWTIGGIGEGTVKTITKIKTCLSSGFTIEGDQEGRIFNYYNGHQKALTGKISHSASFCSLVSEQDIIELKQKWEVDKVKQELITSIKDGFNSLKNLSIDQLTQINNLIKQ